MPLFANIPDSRRRTMSAIRSRGNRSTERRFRASLAARGVRGWRMHPESVQGRPDFYFRESRLAVFVDGCFWHSCPKCCHQPKSNLSYWQPKLKRNMERDLRVTVCLRRSGVSVLRFWECALAFNLQGAVDQVERRLQHRLKR